MIGGYISAGKILFAALWRFTDLIASKLFVKTLPCYPEQFRRLNFLSAGFMQRVFDARDLHLFNSFGQGEGWLVLHDRDGIGVSPFLQFP